MHVPGSEDVTCIDAPKLPNDVAHDLIGSMTSMLDSTSAGSII